MTILSHSNQKATKHQLAAIHGVSPRTIERWVRAGKIDKPAPDTRPRRRTNAERSNWYVCVFFAHSGPGPYECCFCRQDVTMEDVHVHHVDHDRGNNLPSNLAPCHVRCHMSYHHSQENT